MRNIILFSAVVALFASCKEHEFSKDEPLIPALRPAVYASSQNNVLYALDPTTGKRIWEQDFGTNLMTAEPIVLSGFTFVPTGQGIVKLDADKGTIIDTTKNFSLEGGPVPVSGKPISGKGDIIYTSMANDFIVAYNHKSKGILWAVRFPDAGTKLNSSGSFYNKMFIFTIDNTIRAVNDQDGTQLSWTYTSTVPLNNPVVAAPHVYALGTDGTLTAISGENGASLWTFNTGAPASTSPISYGGNIIYGTDDNKLYCIDSIARAPRWVYLTNERIRGSAYAYDQTVYFGSLDHYFYALNVLDGSLKWRYRMGGLMTSSPIAYEGMIYMGSYDKYLYGFDTTGSIRWKFDANGLIDKSPVLYDLQQATVYPAVSGMSLQ